MRWHLVLVCLSLAGCGASSGGTGTTPVAAATECPARAQLASAEDALGSCRANHASDPGWPARGAYDALLPRLSSHLASLEPPREVTSDEVQPLAEGIWELLDQVEFPPASEAVRGRAESAAERLLRERDARAAPGAAIEALDAVTQVGSVADPTGGTDPCAGESLRVGESRVAEGECPPGT